MSNLTTTSLERDQRDILLAMATGTGKTRTALALIYRLLKARRFHRVLFLVDRTSLGEQAHNAFKNTRMESLNTFEEIYEVKALGDLTPDPTTKVHIATVQAMVRRVLGEAVEGEQPVSDAYDLIIVDECHRGYNQDREMSDVEMEYRPEDDYISKYRRVLDYFDAVRLGLTATPALHTTEIFGDPVHRFGYKEAVVAGILVDHEPPYQIVTKNAEEGLLWRVGEPMEYYNSDTGEVDLIHAPDDVLKEIDSFNRQVVTESFNRVVCDELVGFQQLFPSAPGKTLIFCATDLHADMVVRLLKEAMDDAFGGIKDDHIAKITGAAHEPLQQIRKYKNEQLPKVAVTVDLLTTGIDVPEIVNLVFLRRVKSRILYEQMMGRATRTTKSFDKPCFYIFDAVGLYEAMQGFTDMKPVVTSQSFSFTQLAEELTSVPDPAAQREFLDQLIAKLQRKRLTSQDAETFVAMAQASVKEVLAMLRASTPQAAAAWLAARPGLPAFLDQARGKGPSYLISNHDDEVRRVERGYGKSNRKPADYLEEFATFIRDNLNEIPALKVVTQRPRSLTRAQLKELATLLANEGFTSSYLQTAWEETTNESIAAGIIGFIRQRALGSPLVPYEQRVDRALKTLLASRAWEPKQRQWLDKIGKQVKVETVVDLAALNEGRFRDDGGLKVIDKVFAGQVEHVLGDLQEAIWQDEIA